MIVVLEGISAAGKTTYARGFGEAHHVPEFAEHGEPPSVDDPPHVHADYWIGHNIRRFQAALTVEAEHGLAICDTEPFRSHYDWCMAQAGLTDGEVFACGVPMARAAIASGQLGFGDVYFVKRIDPDVARTQREADLTRTRRNFETHLMLQRHLLRWYEALGAVIPGHVSFAFPDRDAVWQRLAHDRPDSSHRFDPSVLDSLLARLDGTT